MNRSGPFSSRSKPAVKFPAWEMLSIMINQLPQEALVLDTCRGRALMANQAFLDIAGVSASELGAKPLVDLLPGLEWVATANPGQTIELGFGDDKIRRTVFSLTVDKDCEFHLVLLNTPNVEENEQTGTVNSQIYLKLIQLSAASTVDECYQIAMEVMSLITGGKMLAVYRADGDFPRFSRVASSAWEGEFPQSIAAVQNLLQEGTTLWVAGNRTTNELQRFALRSACKYLAVRLVGQPGAGLGLLVVGDDKTEPVETLRNSIEIVGTSLGNALQSILLVNHLRQQLENTSNKLLFRQYMYENSLEGVFFLDRDLNILECNPASEWMFGYSSAEVFNKPIESVLIGTDLLLVALEAARKWNPDP